MKNFINRHIKKLFIASLILNILFAICCVGQCLGSKFGERKFKNFYHGSHKTFENKEEMVIESLPEAKQEQARGVLNQLKEVRRKNFENSKLLFDDIEKIVKAEKFDEEKFLKVFEKFDLAVSSSKKESNKIIAKFLSEIEVEDRVKLIDEIKKQNHFLKYNRSFKRDLEHKKD